MTAWPTTTMTGMINAILATLRAHAWPSPIATVGYRTPFDEFGDPSALVTPALLLNITGRSAAPEALTPPGRVARQCDFELHGILSLNTENIQTELLELSESIYALIESREIPTSPQRGHRWGLGDAVGFPSDIRDDDQGAFAAGLHGYDGRVITWSQVVYLPERSS